MTRRRSGFTLVEILVAMALTVFILAILAETFVTGSDLFRGLKSVGDLNASMRTAANIIRSDLSADHFEGKRRLSDAKFWSTAYNGPPKMGYFYLEQGPPPAVDPQAEGTDADGIASRRRTSHKMAMTVKARGYQPQDYYSVQIPGGPLANLTIGNPQGRYQLAGAFTSQWIEVCYFLAPVTGSVTASGTPLYALYRQQRIVISNNDALNWGGAAAAVPPIPVSWLRTYQSKFSVRANPTTPANLYFNSPADLTIPERRAAGNFPSGALATRAPAGTQVFVGATFNPLTDTNGNPTGEDLLLTDVLTFDIQIVYRSTSTATLANVAGFTDLPAPGPYYFDTWSRRNDDAYQYSNTSATAGFPVPDSRYEILALQITIRVYDEKTQLARQITIVQDM
jgi:prepilin-type N-terminal cleavage/methylation domain-containing protein